MDLDGPFKARKRFVKLSGHSVENADPAEALAQGILQIEVARILSSNLFTDLQCRLVRLESFFLRADLSRDTANAVVCGRQLGLQSRIIASISDELLIVFECQLQ